MNVPHNTYFGAKWQVEVCRSGSEGVSYHYPLGKSSKNNMILDHWLESLIYLYSPSGGLVKAYCPNGLSLAGITKGTLHIGGGSETPNYQQTGLQFPIKSTSYIRPFFNDCTGIYYPESGMAMMSQIYSFEMENSKITYSEAGFRPNIADALPTGKKNWLWSRFVFTREEEVSGYLYITGDINNITHCDMSGYYPSGSNDRHDLLRITDPAYNGFSGEQSFELGWRYIWPENAGMFLINESGNSTGLVQETINVTEPVTGFVSGYLNNNIFYPFTLSDYPNGSSGLSGAYLQDEHSLPLYFASGNGGSNGFYDFTGKYFNVETGFSFSGIKEGFALNGSGFLPTDGPLTGSMTGIIGSRNVFRYDGYITGILAWRNVLNPITLTTGEFLRVKYDIYMKIPAIVDPIPVVGQSLVHGEFNGSGQLKLIGDHKAIFGTIDGNGKIDAGEGFWWPIHTTLYSQIPSKYDRDRTPQPNSHLSMLMIASGSSYNNNFPLINYGPPIISAELHDEKHGCDDYDTVLGSCGGPPLIPYFENNWYSNRGLKLSPPWPLYAHGGVIVHDYVAHNRPQANWPNSIDIQMILLGAYPHSDTGINGFIITSAHEDYVCKPNSSLVNEEGQLFQTYQYIKPTLYENIEAYEECGITRKYSAWYYKLNTPQMKYEDQLINVYLTFSMGRMSL